MTMSTTVEQGGDAAESKRQEAMKHMQDAFAKRANEAGAFYPKEVADALTQEARKRFTDVVLDEYRGKVPPKPALIDNFFSGKQYEAKVKQIVKELVDEKAFDAEAKKYREREAGRMAADPAYAKEANEKAKVREKENYNRFITEIFEEERAELAKKGLISKRIPVSAKLMNETIAAFREEFVKDPNRTQHGDVTEIFFSPENRVQVKKILGKLLEEKFGEEEIELDTSDLS